VCPFTDLKNRISAACGFYMSLFLVVQHSLPYSSVGTAITWYNFICVSFRDFPLSVRLKMPHIFWNF
jgi:hypothetical protein